jgi:CIC family chloride channel protein
MSAAMSQSLVRASGEVIDRPRWSGLWMWGLALVIGVVVGYAALVFRTLISYTEFVVFGGVDTNLALHMPALPWYARLIGPIVTGAILALLLRLGTNIGWGNYPRPYGLSDLVAARRLREPIRVSTLSLRDSFYSLLVGMVSLGGGASAGRECPAMHMGASVGLLPGRILGLGFAQRRMLFGAGAAAGLAAMLGAPIAAVLLVREVLMPRVRLRAMAPVALAAAVAWLAARTGGVSSVVVLPAIVAVPVVDHLAAPVVAGIAGLVAAGLVVLWNETPRLVDREAAARKLPVWLLPSIGGVLTGVIAVGFPQAIGLGYGALQTGAAGGYSFGLMLVLALAKSGATAIAFAFRFGGGRIGPALVIGGLLGAAFGALFGGLSGYSAGPAYFAVIAMSAVLAGVLDCPLAATVLALELSGSVEVAAAALAATHISAWIVRWLTRERIAETEKRL